MKENKTNVMSSVKMSEIDQLQELKVVDKTVIPRLNVLEFDKLDVIMLKKFIENTCYTVQKMQSELISEGKVDHINVETIRKRFDNKFVSKNLITKIKTFGVIYEINDQAIPYIKDLFKRFVEFLGVKDLI
jgi:hypothetical protein